MDRYNGDQCISISNFNGLHTRIDNHWYLSPGYVSDSKRHWRSTLYTQRIMNDGSKRESINCHHYRKGEQRATLPSCLLPLLLFEFRQFQSNSTTQRRGRCGKWRGAAHGHKAATRWQNSAAVIWRWNDARRLASVWHGMAHTLACCGARRL